MRNDVGVPRKKSLSVQLILISVLFSPIPTIAMKKTRIFTGMIRTYVVYLVTEDLAGREDERRALKIT